MKKTILLAALIALSGCKNDMKSDASKTEQEAISESASEENEGSSEIVTQPFYDDKGQLMATVELPANWHLNTKKGGPSILGPGGISVFDIPMRNFMYSNDPYMAQSYAQNGGKLRPYTSAEDVVKQDLLSVAQREGSKLVSVTPLPNVVKVDRSVNDMLFKVGPSNQKFEAVLSEWEDKNGNPYAIVVHLNGSQIGNTIMWNYYCNGLNSPKERYDSAKNTLVAALESMRYNPRYFDSYNQSEQNKASASWAAHHQRMQSRQQAFDSQQAAHRDKWEAINQSSMAAYNSSNASSDRNHNRFLNYIKGEETVTNSGDGKRYQVQGGSNQYYTNDDGQYLGTNDPNYDPNRDPNVNDKTWNQAQKTD